MAKRESRRRVSDAEIAAARAVLMAAEENQRAEKRERQRRNTRRGCAALLVCGIITMGAAALGGGERDGSRVANLPTMAVLPSETPIPSETPLPSETPQPTATPPSTATLSESEVEGTHSAEFVATSIVQLTAMVQPSDVPTATETPAGELAAGDNVLPFDEVQYIFLIEEAYVGSANRPTQVLAANGRENGGEIVVIVSYMSRAFSEDDIRREAAMMLIPMSDAIVQQGLDVDSVVLSIGDARGQALGVAGVSAADLMAYRSGEMSLTAFVDAIDYSSMVNLGGDATPVATAFRVATLPPAMPSTLAPPISTPVQQGSMYVCNGINDLNCDDFPRGSGDATRHLQQCGDEDALDRDGDGRACEDQ